MKFTKLSVLTGLSLMPLIIAGCQGAPTQPATNIAMEQTKVAITAESVESKLRESGYVLPEKATQVYCDKVVLDLNNEVPVPIYLWDDIVAKALNEGETPRSYMEDVGLCVGESPNFAVYLALSDDYIGKSRSVPGWLWDEVKKREKLEGATVLYMRSNFSNIEPHPDCGEVDIYYLPDGFKSRTLQFVGANIGIVDGKDQRTDAIANHILQDLADKKMLCENYKPEEVK